MEMYGFFRSSASHRLRIALNLKGLKPRHHAIDLRVDEQAQAPFKAVNPQGLVPALILEDGTTLIQSPAIIEWLEERCPEPALLPTASNDRAHVRAVAAIIGCDVHPINNRRILQYLRKQFAADETAVNAWCSNWITAGFDAVEAMLAQDKQRGAFCYGGSPTLADVYLVPQVESARRFGVDTRRWPLVSSVDKTCQTMPAFAKAAPTAQQDTK